MLSHVVFGCCDIKRSSAFYDALLAPLGITRRKESNNNLPYAYWVDPDNSNAKFFVCLPFNNAAAAAGNGNMVAFNAASIARVDDAYQAAISLGGTDEGPPGLLRPQYGHQYYGAYLRDLDGNKINLVYHGAK